MEPLENPSRGEPWFSGPGMKHPLTDLDAARSMIAKHSTGDAVAVLGRITRWIEELSALPELSIEHRFAVLDLLDQRAKNHQISLIPEYLETARLRKLSEGALWTASFGFWKAIGDAYLNCLEYYQNHPEISAKWSATMAEEPLATLPILTGRTLRALTLQLKWTLLKHGHVDAGLWRNLGRTYLFAENHGFADRRVAVYQSRHGESSARQEFLKMLMLAMSAPEALDPARQHIAERIIAHFGDRFVLARAPGEGQNFFFDLATGAPPARARIGTLAPMQPCYFGPGREVYEALGSLGADVARLGSLPPFFALGPGFTREQIDAVLAHLSRSWADEAPARHGHRQESAQSLLVVPGLADNVRWLAGMIEAGSAAVAPPASADTWQVSDASEQGCGALIIGSPPEWLAIGALIGIRDEHHKTCRMAIVRRTHQDPGEQFRVGLQLLGDAAAPVALFPLAATLATNRALPGEPALLLNSRPGPDDIVELIIRGDGVADGKAVQMRFIDRVHRLEPVSTIESGRGFRWASYRVSPN